MAPNALRHVRQHARHNARQGIEQRYKFCIVTGGGGGGGDDKARDTASARSDKAGGGPRYSA